MPRFDTFCFGEFQRKIIISTFFFFFFTSVRSGISVQENLRVRNLKNPDSLCTFTVPWAFASLLLNC